MRARLQLVPRRTAIEDAHFPPNDASVDELNAFRTPAQRRLIFEEFFLFQIGHAWRRHATGTELKPFVPTVDDRIRAAAAKILPFKLTPGQRQAVEGDRRRHAAAAADAPAAAGRRRRGQDDRRAAGGARRDGERAAGGVHGADRDPGRAALRQHRAAAVAVAVPRRPADRAARRACRSTRCTRTSSAARRT